MKNKRLAALLLAGMLFAQSISANAQVPFNVYQGTEGVTDISLQWTNVNDITLDLYFEDGEAGCSGEIRALSGTTKISQLSLLSEKAGQPGYLKSRGVAVQTPIHFPFWNRCCHGGIYISLERYG